MIKKIKNIMSFMDNLLSRFRKIFVNSITAFFLLLITIGVFSVIGVMTAIRTLESSVEKGLNVFGTNTFYITKRPEFQFGKGRRWRYKNRPNITYQLYEDLKARAHTIYC